MQNLDLEIRYKHTWIDHPLLITFFIDNRVIYFDNSGKNSVCIQKKIKLEENVHELKIKIQNKNEANTLIDHKSKILQDTLFNLENLSFDGIEITNLILQRDDIAQFYVNNKPTDIIHKTLEYGHNGTFHMKFSVPVYDWLLETLF